MTWFNRAWKKVSAGVAAILVALGIWVTAQTLPSAALTATAPSTNTDGSPLTDLMSIRVYKAVVTGAAPNCATATFGVLATVPYDVEGGAFAYSDQNLNVTGRHCYRLTALRAGGTESAPSNIGFKDVDVRAPSAPTSLTVN